MGRGFFMERIRIMIVRIGAVAQQVGVSPQTLRNYEKVGLIPQSKRTLRGHRYYAIDDVPKIAAAIFGGRQAAGAR